MRNRIYYLLKPYVPRSLRMGLRRISARRTLRESGEVWPILESASRVPSGWPGWPDGRQFAVVLTHDVEGPSGLERVRSLAELEIQSGFRSSFNFVPEGDYSLPHDLRPWLEQQGFEVGVHDLHHDGRLYDSREGFRRRARRINEHLAAWKAQGFRSGFMHHNLDWLHDLHIRYDASTFDTDPFEPQPDGVGTIFPFWVPAPTREPVGANEAGKGYVELPYTLPQDSTLFEILQQQDGAVWRRKVDWIAERGGMVLVNVHPDYLGRRGRHGAPSRIPEEHYRDLLRYLQERYRGKFWHALPRDVAEWYRQAVPPSRQTAPPPSSASVDLSPPTAATPPMVPERACLAGRRAAVLLYSYYPADPRPRRAAEALALAGMQVDLFCLSENPGEPRREFIRGVQVFRLRMKRRRDSKLTYLYLYGAFLLASFTFLLRRSFRVRYDVVHVHNMPDFLVFSALVPRLLGARILLDLHDPMPELMTSIYGLPPHRPEVRLLRLLERWSIAFSHLAFTPNIAFRDLFVSRGCPPDKMEIIMNSPEESIFDPGRQVLPLPASQATNGEFRLIHHGSLVHRHGIDILIESVHLVRAHLPAVRLDIYGARTEFLDAVLALARERGLDDCVTYHGPRPQQEIARAIAASDLGIIPNRRSPFTEINFPTRVFEYLAMGRPVIAPNTRGIRDYFTPDEICFFEPDDAAALARQILWVRDHPAKVQAMVERGRAVYRAHLWSRERAHLVRLVEGLFRDSSPPCPTPIAVAPSLAQTSGASTTDSR